MSERRVVVLGASGFVGSRVCALAGTQGLDVVGLSSKDVNLMSSAAASILASLLRGGDTIVHSAAIAPARSAGEVAANLLMTQCLVDATKGLDVAQLVVISSDAVYGSASGVVTEQSACTPDSLHGAMSLAREIASAEVLARTLTIVRPAPIYGLGDPHNSYGPNRFARQALSDGRISLFGAGEAGRDHVDIADVSAVVVRCIMEVVAGVVNVASGQMRSFAQIAEIVQAAAPADTTVAPTGSESSPTYRSFDLSGLVRRFPDHVPTVPEEGIPAMVRTMGGLT